MAAHEYYSADYTAATKGQASAYQQGAYEQAGYHAAHPSAYQQQQGYPQPGYNTAYYPQQAPGYAATHAWQQAADPQQYQYQQYAVQDGPYGGSGTSGGVGALPPLPSDPPQPPLPEGALPQLPSGPAPPLPEQPPLPSDPPSGAAPPLPPGPVGPQDSNAAYVGPAGAMSGTQLPYPPAQHTQEQQQQQQQHGPVVVGQYVQYSQQQGYQQQQAYHQQQYLQQQQQQQQQQYGAYPGGQQQGYYANGWGGGGHAYGHTGAMPYVSGLAAAPPHMQHAGMPYPQHQPAAAAQPLGYLHQQQHAVPAPAAAPAAQPPLRPQRGALADLLLPPGRAKRPKRLVLLLRGLPGSGKSRLARLVRDRETEQGGEPPRILSLDDYFMTEVEREVEDDEGGTGGGAKKGRKRKVQVMEYCYEPEMEGVYKRSLLKAYQRTLDEARFRFVILDAPNIRAADFRDFWMAGQAAGYEVFVVEMPESDPQVCYQRNQHRRKVEDLYRLSSEYEATPAVYACLDASSLLAKKQPPGGKAAISDVDMGEDEADGSDADAEGDTPAGAPSSSRWASLEDGSSSPGAAERSKRARLASNGSTSSLDRDAAGDRSGSGGSTQSMRSAGGDATYDGLADGIDEMLDRAATGSVAARGSGRGTGRARSGGGVRSGSSGSGRGILSSGGGGSGGRKRVRWPDQMEEDEREDAGFRIGAESRQLETVYMVEGLGPPSGGTHPHPASFAAAVKAEHRVEANAFRSVMLGGAPKRLPGGGGGSSSKGA